MTASVPKLVPLPVGWTIRMLGSMLPGVRAALRQIDPYTAWWNKQNQNAVAMTGPLLAVVGDSTAIGIGASAPHRGFVGQVRDRLHEHHQGSWRVINLALSGARIQDALDRQLPVVEHLRPDLVICCIGTNDVVWDRETTALPSKLHQLAAGLPVGSYLSTLSGTSKRAQLANSAILSAADDHKLVVVNPWDEPGPPPKQRLAGDRFHPNDIGYELMGRAFARHLGLPDAGEVPGDETQR